MAQSSLTLTIDAEAFRADLERMVDDIVSRAAQSLDVRIRMIVRDEMNKQFAFSLRDHQATRR